MLVIAHSLPSCHAQRSDIQTAGPLPWGDKASRGQIFVGSSRFVFIVYSYIYTVVDTVDTVDFPSYHCNGINGCFCINGRTPQAFRAALHQAGQFMLDFLIGFSLSKEQNLKDVPEANDIRPTVTDRDIFKTKITELISEIAEDSIGFFENRPDYRWKYKQFYRISFSKKFKANFTLDDMKKEMEANSLIFNAEMFQDAERDPYFSHAASKKACALQK